MNDGPGVCADPIEVRASEACLARAMDASSPSNDWDPLGTSDAFYRRLQLYSLTWTLPGGDLSDFVIAGARNGGPIALTRDESKPVLLRDAGDVANASSKSKKRIWVYSSAGILLHSIIVRDPVARKRRAAKHE